MHKFPITQYNYFNELPLESFNSFKYSIYLLDFDWNYRFINEFAKNNLGAKGQNLVGKNMWTEFPELAKDPAFVKMKLDIERGVLSNFTVISPVISKRLHIVGHKLDDCFFFSASILPDKEDLINELRGHLNKG